MFPISNLFKDVLCPSHRSCTLSNCLFSHDSSLVYQPQVPQNPESKAQKRPPNSPRVSEVKKAVKTSSATSPSLPGVETPRNSEVAKPNSAAFSTPKESKTSPWKAIQKPPASPIPSPITKSAQRAESAKNQDLSDLGPPRIEFMAGKVHTATSTRQKMLTTLYNQFIILYSKLPHQSRAKALASKHAKDQELTLYKKTTGGTYRNSVISCLAQLKKRSPPTKERETGTMEMENERIKKLEEARRGMITRERIQKFIATEDQLKSYDYLVKVPENVGGTIPTEEGRMRNCERCSKPFLVTGDLTDEHFEMCSFHWGRLRYQVLSSGKARAWTCCPTPEAPSCSSGPHVFKDEDVETLHDRVPFIHTANLKSIETTSSKEFKYDVIALDCELVYTTAGMSLARLTVVAPDGGVILDEHVIPQGTVLDRNTRFSGVKEGDLESATMDIKDVREALGRLMGPDTVIIGHGLENDLRALRIVHPWVIDTTILYPHIKGPPFRTALRDLTRDQLGKFIQTGGATDGHSAAEDSIAALELVRHKMKQGIR